MFRSAGWLGVGLLICCGCGASSANQADAERSYREFQLAASLREEGQTASSIDHLRRALELDPSNAEAQLLLGFVQMERRDFVSAEEHLRQGIALLEKKDRKGSTLAEAENIYGVCLTELERYDEAKEVLRKSATDELNTSPHLAWGNLGKAQFYSGELPEAVSSTMEAVRLEPRFCIGFYTMGEALARMQRWDDAERALVQAIEADEECEGSPQLQGAWLLRGEVRAELGHRQDAVADLERCVELGPYTNHGRMCQKLLEGQR